MFSIFTHETRTPVTQTMSLGYLWKNSIISLNKTTSLSASKKYNLLLEILQKHR